MMRYKLLGRSGLRVSELCLGTMTFGEDWEIGASEADSRAVFDVYAEAGGNFLDTANGYTNGTSEKLLGKFVGAERDTFVVATKFTANMRPGDPNAGGNARKTQRQNVEASLSRLGTDYIDLLWVHAWDLFTSTEEVMRGLDDLVQSGKVLYVGISNAPAWIVSQANMLADLRGWSPFVGLQIEYSLIERAGERELLPMARALDIAVTPWSPLGGGVLTGKYNKEAVKIAAQTGDGARRLDGGSNFAAMQKPDERKLAIAAEVVKIADELGKSPAQVALNWLRAQPGTMIPIIASRRPTQLRDNLACVGWTLEPAHLARLDAASIIDLGYPHNFLGSVAPGFLYGGTYDQIDAPTVPRP